MSGPEDRISWRAKDYAASRPDYPGRLFRILESLGPGRRLAWDCATGNGQAAIPLARSFRSVFATDADEGQISYAKAHPRIRYSVAPADQAPVADASVDLVTVAQALHWFDLPSFYGEVGRVLKPGGLFAAWSYFLPSVSKGVDVAVRRIYDEGTEGDLLRKLKLVEGQYKSISLPFGELPRRSVSMVARWRFPRFARYLGTLSVVPSHTLRAESEPLAAEIEQELKVAWGVPNRLRHVRWTITMLVGRKISGQPM
jgi:SAM-dependent methyltransferase